jgi:glucuronide carrier protein
VITLFETYGAGADVIGPRLAEALGVPYVGQVFSSDDIEDRSDPHEGWIGRLVASLVGPGAAESAIEAAPEQEALVRENVAAVLDAAKTGGVILGRNATVILADHPGALHVKLDGAPDHRIARAAAAAGIDEAQAGRRLAREERARAEMSLALYGWDPRLNDRYHLVVNTSLLGDDVTLQVILDAYGRLT